MPVHMQEIRIVLRQGATARLLTAARGPLRGQPGCCLNHHPPPRTRTNLQRPHLARRCPNWGCPSPVTLKPHPGHSRLQRNLSISLRTFSFRPLPPCSGAFASVSGGRVALSRAATSSLVSFSPGLDRPQQRGSFGHVPPCLRLPGLVREAVVAQMFTVQLSGTFRTVFSLTSRSCAIFLG